MRGLSEPFLNQLNNGVLNPILMAVKRDSTLCLEIRDDYVDIYYRGGRILGIENKGSSFRATFDTNYFSGAIPLNHSSLPMDIRSNNDMNKWVEALPINKYAMDLWLTEHPKDERQFQQLLSYENNSNKCAKGTDYFICDIEYASPNGRFDLIAARWPSTSNDRRSGEGLGLAIIEMKYADSALARGSGLKEHMADFQKHLSSLATVFSLKSEMKTLFNQKLSLGLIDNQNPIASFNDDAPEVIFVLANHDPCSKVLGRELSELKVVFGDIVPKFAVSSFMGYGLYGQNIYTLDAFLERFKTQIFDEA